MLAVAERGRQALPIAGRDVVDDDVSGDVLERPLGIASASWHRSSDGTGMGGGGTEYRSRDLAKLGQLITDGGRWHDRQIVSADWVRAMAQVHAQTPFQVVLRTTNGSVRLEVLDGSRSRPVLVVARALDTGGRGVAIVQAVSQDWGSTANSFGGKSVWAEFDRLAA